MTSARGVWITFSMERMFYPLVYLVSVCQLFINLHLHSAFILVRDIASIDHTIDYFRSLEGAVSGVETAAAAVERLNRA
jgi:hypothetical protein